MMKKDNKIRKNNRGIKGVLLALVIILLGIGTGELLVYLGVVKIPGLSQSETDEKTVESKSAKKNSGKTQTSDQEWKTAYAQFLRNGGYKSDMPGCDAPRFFVYDVDGDGSMELVIIRATYSVVGGDVYTLVNGKVVYAGGTSGTYGSFASYPSDGLILSSYGHMGVDLEEYFTLSDGKLVSQARWISSFTDGETWYLNDQETTQEAYENWKEEHVSGEIFAIEYNDSHPITEENIQAYVK